jgi:hypothetical protein
MPRAALELSGAGAEVVAELKFLPSRSSSAKMTSPNTYDQLLLARAEEEVRLFLGLPTREPASNLAPFPTTAEKSVFTAQLRTSERGSSERSMSCARGGWEGGGGEGGG